MNEDNLPVMKPVAKLRKFNKKVKVDPTQSKPGLIKRSNLTEIDEEIENDGMEDDKDPKPIASLSKVYKVVRKRK